MNRATIGFYLAVVLGSCSMNGVSQADELLTRDDFFVADESRHQWVTEHNGRTGSSERQRCISVISVHTGYARS